MSDTKFTPDSWVNAGEQMKTASQDLQAAAIDLQTAPSVPRPGILGLFAASEIDKIVDQEDERISTGFYRGTGTMIMKLNSDASKLHATGVNYKKSAHAAEDVATKHWSY